MRRRLLSLLLAVTMVLGMLPLPSFAEEIVEEIAEEEIIDQEETAGALMHSTEVAYSLAEGVPFEVAVNGELLVLTDNGPVNCAENSESAEKYTGSVSGEEITITFSEESAEYSKVQCIVDWGFGYTEVVEECTPDSGTVTLDYPLASDYLCIYDDASGTYSHLYLVDLTPRFTATVDGEEIVPETLELIKGKPAFLLTVPEGTEAVDFVFESEKDYHFYNDAGIFLGNGVTESNKKHKIPVQDKYKVGERNGEPWAEESQDGTLDGISVQKAGVSSTEFFVMFAYAEENTHQHDYGEGTVTTAPGCETPGVRTYTCTCGDSYTDPITATGHAYEKGICKNCNGADPDYVAPSPEPAKPFLSIALNGVEIEDNCIASKGIFLLGDYHKDEQQEPQDSYDYVHEVPYYHVSVPCGTDFVDVTYSKDTNILVDEGTTTARGYVTDLEVDAVSSATVRGVAFGDGYTQNEDGTQTVKTPVKGYTFNDKGRGRAITLEEDGGAYKAICLFTFEYDRQNHVYVESVTKQPCVEAGEKTFTCSCGHSYTDSIPATGSHDFENGSCTACGAKDPDYHEHSYDGGVVTTEPGCVSEGVKTFTCSGCEEGTEGHTKTETIEAVGHDYGDPVEILATCAARGSKTWTCNNCDKDTPGHTKTEFTDKAEHTYDNEEDTTPATCTADGVKTFTCSKCEEGVEGHTKTEPITKLGHDYQNGVCTRCGDEAPELVDGVYQIGSAKQLLWFAKAVNGGDKAISGKLTADITLDSSWPGIGNSTYKFAGSFDGQGYTVTFDNTTVGLFFYTQGADKAYTQIKNVNTAGTVNGEAALIARARYTNVENCINRADVTGSSYAAGIVAVAASSHGATEGGYVTITNCGNEGNITGGTRGVGGIAAFAKGCMTVTGCYNTGTIYGTAASNSVSGNGGIVGFMQGYPNASYVRQCYNLGQVSGSSLSGGLVGTLYNSAEIIDSYNAGEATYAIIGSAYQKSKGTIKNSYYLASASTMGIPADHSGSYEFTAKTQAEMNEESFLTALGSSFKLSCPTPVLTWQETQSHTGMEEDGICDVCGLGSNVKETYNVIAPTTAGVIFEGDPTATQGESYTFRVSIDEKNYRPTESFAVKVNNTRVYENNGSYTWQMVEGALNITVEGVEPIPETLKITLPNGEGKGYRVVAEVAGSTTVAYNGTFRFKVNMHENFQKSSKFQVLVDGSTEIRPDENGWYALSNVQYDKTITVSGVEPKPYGDTADILLTITYGENELYKTPEASSNQLMLHTELEVPYFDIGLYGMSHCYYNPDCYGFNADGTRKPQIGGTAESAYGIITPLHAFIYATEVHYLNVPADKVGTGWSYEKGTFQDAIRWSGGVGSIFMYLWDHGSNLNYYVNYEYPLGAPGWGSTSDQIVLKDGDTLSAHMIASGDVDENGDANVETSAANGSAYGVFVVDDTNGSFDYGSDTIHSYEVKRGETVDLTLFSSVATSTYDTAYTTLANRQLYWIHDDYLTGNMTEWNKGEGMVTDRSGRYILDTSAFEPDVYYIGALGGFTEGDGKADAGGFVSAGYERGVAVLKLTITDGDSGTDAPGLADGDINGDTFITADDAAAAFAASKSTAGMTAAQKTAADVNRDGYITADDAATIFAMSKGGAN